jgi:kinesin family protein 2/24
MAQPAAGVEQNGLPYWVDFELGEDVRSETRLLQDELWQGAVQDGRAHLSHREASKAHASKYKSSISYFRVGEVLADCYNDVKNSRLSRLPPPLLRIVLDFVCAQGACVIESLTRRERMIPPSSNFRLVVRKRPLLAHEVEQGEYDVCNTSVAPSGSTVVLHHGQLARNGRRLSMAHRSFRVDAALGDCVDNESFARRECSSILSHVSGSGSATILAFGQTGTGKTYSFAACLSYLARELGGERLSVSFYEIHGKKAYDLLSSRKEVKLLSDENDSVCLRGAREEVVQGGSPELDTLISEALALRSSLATERNPLSSRSHAVCSLRLLRNGGCVRLVDLAGSERNAETLRMTAKMHQDSADINRSLWALKECMVAAHRGKRIPYRAHTLTRVLRDCFDFRSSQHRTTIIATVSPSPTDLLHSLNSLEHACMLSPALEAAKGSVTVELPLNEGAALSHVAIEHWGSAQVTTWLSTAEGGRFAALVLPTGLDGAGLMQLNTTSLTALFAGQLRQARQGEEGAAWVIDTDTDTKASVSSSSTNADAAAPAPAPGVRTSSIGRALWAALRREAQSSARQRASEKFL